MSTLEVTRARLGSEGFEGSDFVTSWHRKSFNFFTLGFLISTIMFEVSDDLKIFFRLTLQFNKFLTHALENLSAILLPLFPFPGT